MLKVTLIFIFYCAVFLLLGCNAENKELIDVQTQAYRDSLSEIRIDSAYAEIRLNCDSLMVIQVPKMVDSVMKDSNLIRLFFDTTLQFTDADKKVERVVRQLQADCDSSLRKETYRRVRLLQKVKPKRRKK